MGKLRRFGIASRIGLHAKPYHYAAKIRLLMLRVGKDVPDIQKPQLAFRGNFNLYMAALMLLTVKRTSFIVRGSVAVAI